MLSEGSQHEKPHIKLFHLYEVSCKSKPTEIESKTVTTWGWGWGWERGSTVAGARNLAGVTTMFQNWTLARIAQLS